MTTSRRSFVTSVAAGTALAARAARPAIARLLGASAQSAAELMIHCAQEMAHLAAFLPELHADITGSVL